MIIDAMTAGDLDAALAIDLASFHPSELGVGSAARHDANDGVGSAARHDANDRNESKANVEARKLRARQLEEELARPWARVRVARGDGGAVIGYSLYWHVADELHLLNVAVAPSERRRGIGRALMHELFEYATQHGARRVLLEVRKTNVAAIRLYESLGFEHLRVRTRYYDDGEDALEMLAIVEPWPVVTRPRDPA